MYKNLCADALGVTGRQSELIELTMTYGFRGFDLDMADVAKRAETQGSDHALRFLQSAGLKIGGFKLPVRWEGDVADYKANLAELPQVAEVAKSLGADRCYLTVPPATDTLPFNEFFEQSRTRIAEIADVLATQEIRLGLGFHAAADRREGFQFQFIHQAEALLTLMKSIGSSNVGLLLDLWNWRVGGGGTDQLRDLSAEQIVIVRLSDVPEDADLATIEESQRTIPEVTETSEAIKVLTFLGEIAYDGPVTLNANASQFSTTKRDAVVKEASQKLDDLFKAAGINKAGKLAVAAEA